MRPAGRGRGRGVSRKQIAEEIGGDRPFHGQLDDEEASSKAGKDSLEAPEPEGMDVDAEGNAASSRAAQKAPSLLDELLSLPLYGSASLAADADEAGAWPTCSLSDCMKHWDAALISSQAC